jgi:hypothetical protein
MPARRRILNEVVVDLFRQRVELERRFGAHLLRNPLDRRDLMAYSRSISMTAESAAGCCRRVR